jgi:endoglucanase
MRCTTRPVSSAFRHGVRGLGLVRNGSLRPRVLRHGAAIVTAMVPLVVLGPAPADPATVPTPVVAVDGSGHLTNRGVPWQLRGVDKSGAEYACVQSTSTYSGTTYAGFGVFSGDATQTGINSMLAWHVNAVRLPLNESCVLGDPRVNPKYRGASYVSAVQNYVSLLAANGIVTILDLHWNAPGTELATTQQPMADADHATAFWSTVANAFKGYPSVIFDLYNEPHGISWSCWKSGGCSAVDTSGAAYTVAGMDQMLAAVRATGAGNVVAANGLQWGNDLTGWLANRPADPLVQIVAGAHVYSFNGCRTPTCWDSTLGPILATTPVVVSETGTNDCTAGFDTATLFPWADAHPTGSVSYLAWSWNVASCGGGPSLVTSSSSGAPTNGCGSGIKAYLVARPALPAN